MRNVEQRVANMLHHTWQYLHYNSSVYFHHKHYPDCVLISPYKTNQIQNKKKIVFCITLPNLNISDHFVSIVLVYREIINFLTLFSVIELKMFFKIIDPSMLLSFSLSHQTLSMLFTCCTTWSCYFFPFENKTSLQSMKVQNHYSFTVWGMSISFAFIAYFTTGPSLANYLTIATSCLLIFVYSFICYSKYRRNNIQNNERIQRHGQESDKDVLIYPLILTFLFCLYYLPKSFPSSSSIQ